jgi:hypothetical protein
MVIFLTRAIGLTLQCVHRKIDFRVSVSIDFLNSSNIFCPISEGIMCPKVNLNAHLCSEGRKHRITEKLHLLLSFSAPIRSGRLFFLVENIVSTLNFSGNKETV